MMFIVAIMSFGTLFCCFFCKNVQNNRIVLQTEKLTLILAHLSLSHLRRTYFVPPECSPVRFTVKIPTRVFSRTFFVRAYLQNARRLKEFRLKKYVETCSKWHIFMNLLWVFLFFFWKFNNLSIRDV